MKKSEVLSQVKALVRNTPGSTASEVALIPEAKRLKRYRSDQFEDIRRYKLQVTSHSLYNFVQLYTTLYKVALVLARKKSHLKRGDGRFEPAEEEPC